MARIVDANKADVLRTITLDEYTAQLEVRVNEDGEGSIQIRLNNDPRVWARQQVRSFLTSMDLEAIETLDEMRSTILAKLDEHDLSTQQTWGTDKGKQQPYTATVWFDRPIAKALVNLLSQNEISSDVRDAIRSAITTSSDTKGF